MKGIDKARELLVTQNTLKKVLTVIICLLKPQSPDSVFFELMY